MKSLLIVVAVLGSAHSVCAAADSPPCPPKAGSPAKCSPGDYCVTKAKMSGVCQVQKAVASKLGEYFCGPYKTETEAIAAMCSQYNPKAQEVGEGCQQVNPEDACKKMPPKSRSVPPSD